MELNLVYALTCVVSLAIIYFVFFGKPSPANNNSSTSKKSTEVEEDLSDRPQLTILYGTQTGTAEDYANQFSAETKRYGFKPVLVDMVDMQGEDLCQEKLIVLIVSTYGEGEPTDNSRELFDWVTSKDREANCFSGVKYTVFGLGNKQYKIYQAVARILDARLEELGATRVFVRGEGDADASLEEDFEDWKSQVLPFLSAEYHTEVGEEKIEQKCDLKFLEEKIQPRPAQRRAIYDQKNPYESTILVNKKLLKTNDRTTVHVEFDIKGTNISYEAGDHLAVFPENPEALVKGYLKRLELEDKTETAFTLISREKKTNYFPKKCTVKTAFTYYLHLNCIAKKKLLKGLALYAADEKEKKELTMLASNTDEGKKAYQHEIKDHAMDALDVLNKYKSVKIPLGLFLELMPRLQPRYYSIASSSLMQPDAIHVVVAVVTWNTNHGKKVDGICSTFLQKLQEGHKASIFVRRSTFHHPEDTTKPVIMIGPGTGAAPFRGFIQQRTGFKKKNKDLGECVFYFGCRKKDEDFIYQEELEFAQKSGVISDLRVAFSRDKKQKEYVQHKLEEDADKVWKILESKGHIYVCGDAKYMAKDVDKTLIGIAQKFLGDEKKAIEYIDKLSKENRYLKDVWSP